MKPYGQDMDGWIAVLCDVLMERGIPAEYVARVKLAMDPETLMLPPDTVRQWLRLRQSMYFTPFGSPPSPGQLPPRAHYEPAPRADVEVCALLLRQVAHPIGITEGDEFIRAQHRAINAGLKP